MARRKSNKQVKAMLSDLMRDKFNCKHDDFWWQDGELWVYEPPIGYFEGDEIRFWWHWQGELYVSIKANQEEV